MAFNIIGFQVIWFGSIFFGDAFLAVSLLLFAMHLTYHKAHRRSDLKLAALCLCFGIVIDNGLLFFDVMAFSDTGYTQYMVPLWLLSLWFAFGLTLNHSMKFFKERKVLAFACGALFGPLSYLAGQRLGAVEMGYEPLWTFVVFAIIWAPLFSFLTHLSQPNVSSELQKA